MSDPIAIPIVAIAISVPLVLVPTVLGIRYKQRRRELEHAERMKALELGRNLPRDDSWWTLPRFSLAIGVGVPAVVFSCALQASDHRGAAAEGAWVAAGLVALAAVVSASVLAARHYLSGHESGHAGRGFESKESIDADAYDVVSNRG
jgi:hypothetical protein